MGRQHMTTVVLGCLNFDFALYTLFWLAAQACDSKKVEKVEVGHRLGDSIRRLLCLAAEGLPSLHKWAQKMFFSHLVEASYLALYMGFDVDGYTLVENLQRVGVLRVTNVL